MQTKSSYSVLKWAFLAGVTAAMASACVVSSGDGNDDDTDITEGGDGGTSSNTGGKSTGGGGSSAGTTAGSSASGAPTTDGGEPATGGMPSTFVPGVCQGPADEAPTPTVEPSCDAVDGDSACIACVKLKACSAYQTCFGEEPTTACSVGDMEGDVGQFVCVSECYKAGLADALDLNMLLAECAVQCDDCADGLLNDETGALIDEARMTANCEAECFPTE